MRISDWSSDVCSSDLRERDRGDRRGGAEFEREVAVGHRVDAVRHRPVEAERLCRRVAVERKAGPRERRGAERRFVEPRARIAKARAVAARPFDIGEERSEEHTSELQSLMRIPYAGFC